MAAWVKMAEDEQAAIKGVKKPGKVTNPTPAEIKQLQAWVNNVQKTV